MYRSAVGHTVSRDVNSQARVHQVWTLERSEVQNFSPGLVFPVWRICMHMNGSQRIEKCSVTAPLHICLDIIWINQITLRRDLDVFVVGRGLSKSRNQPLMHITYPHHITQFLCVFLRTHIYDTSLYSQYKSVREKPSTQEAGAIFTTAPQQKQTQDIIEEIAISLNLALKLHRPIDHGYFSKLSG